MKDCVFVVRSRPVAGESDAFNQWYDQQHIADVLAVPGVISARRYRMIDGDSVNYLALYNICADNPFAVLDEIGNRTGGEQMPISSSLDMDSIDALLFEAVGDWQFTPGKQSDH